jgi:hypothetical protein
MPSAFSVVAIIAAYNEADIIEHVVADLIDQGVSVYFLDDGSTDDTARIVERFVGRGVLRIESLRDEANEGNREGPRQFDWERILIRKSELAGELDADWFIHHDADEFRESPWRGVRLADAIRHVDALGFNAIDFAGLDFWPVHDRFTPGSDVRQAFTSYADLAPHDRLQIRCWKNTGQPVDLASSGGHEAKFADRKVFPLRFLLRHYPVRGQAHGERKVFHERRNRFLEQERARGWHVQYDEVREGVSFLRDPATLTPYDADRVRASLALRHREAEELAAKVEESRAEVNRLREELQTSRAEWTRISAERDRMQNQLAAAATEAASAAAEAAALHQSLQLRTEELATTTASARVDIDAKTAYIETLGGVLADRETQIERWRSSVDSLSARVAELERSISWRWTAPARRAYRLLRGR